MGNVIQIAAVQARRSRRRADDLVIRIESVREEAERRGFSTLAYFLDIAVTEALVQARRSAETDVPLGQEAADAPVASD